MKTTIANVPLADLLDQHTTAAATELWRAEGDRSRCLACGHRCLIGEGQRGICKVRFQSDGELRVPFGYVAGLQCDPVEKKPFFHVYPGSDALTFGMMGCDLHCAYCQNWITSQALRDKSAVAPVRPVSAADLVATARREQAKLVVSSYNEPLITAEWAVAVFREANAAGLACAFVSNGNATPEVLDFLRPWIVAYKVDLKSFNDRNYRKLGGTLDNILQTIRMIHERGIWLEIVTLVIPGFNDSPDELRQVARFLASVSRDIPWHITAFHKDYRMTDPDATSAETLVRAAEIGTEEGLRFIYAGNLPGQVGAWENTRCPSCSATVIERIGYLIRSYRLSGDGRCPDCQTQLPGVWPESRGAVRTGNDRLAYQSRLPRPVALASQANGGTPKMSAPSLIQSTRLELNAEQQSQVVSATAAMIRAVLRGEQAVFPGELTAVRDLPVTGAFVSLKRGRHLRSCCGLLGQTLPLHQALAHAADRTIWEDERFPPVSPSELEHLEMEVWLLHNPQRVDARGAERAARIELGRHGIKVVRGQASALFLPSVATENKWDAQRFLDRVCAKAGLAPSAWREDDTALFTFEGDVIRSPLSRSEGGTPLVPQPPVRAEDLGNFTALCRDNLAAMLMGATPRYFIGAPDGTVNGIIFSMLRPETGEVRSFSRFSLRPGVALQATLFSLLQPAAQHLASLRMLPDGVDALPMGLAFLHDPVLHGSVADPHLAGFDSRQRAFLVMERNKAGLAFDASRNAQDLLHEAANQARVSQPENALVFSLTAVGNMNRFSFSTAPQAVRGPAVRPPAVAGTFYPADPAELSRTVDDLLKGEATRGRWQAAMVPHAGLRYSGRLAADVLKRIQIPKTVIVIGPKHTNLGVEWAVAPQQTWSLPGIEVASDFLLARRLCHAIPGLEMDAAAHQGEHGTEVELPLLARLAPQTKVVGITIGHGDLETCKRFARGLAEVLQGRDDRPLLLISSDMNHFATDPETRRLDALALAALDKGDAAELLKTCTQNEISMCGVLPAVIVLETLRLLGWSNKTERVGYATTADVTGDPSRVVGYAGMLFS